MKNLYALIMAGGIGERFWPLSRPYKPKQLLSLFSSEPMILETANRFRGMVKPGNIVYVVDRGTGDFLKSRGVKGEIIIEPEGKNTAAAICNGCMSICSRDKNAVVITVPADHYIGSVNKFKAVMRKAVKNAVKTRAIQTIGIKPTFPSTGYGYISVVKSVRDKSSGSIYKVKSFVEKPGIRKAQRYIKSGNYYWNSGMFVFTAETALNEIAGHAADVYRAIKGIYSGSGKSGYGKVKRAYSRVRAVSFDYAVMEKTGNAYLIPADFRWDDVGAWRSLFNLIPLDNASNAVKGRAVLHNSKGNLIYSDDDHLIACCGISDVIIVKAGDATLICDKSAAEDVKQIARIVNVQKGCRSKRRPRR